jgi:hypothetical protein|tara:strand:- start:492 stop:725 length:234 start_codon:yes stop_codon:yes gene_type:complete
MTVVVTKHFFIQSPEESIDNLVEFLESEYSYNLDQIMMIIRGDFTEALESLYGRDISTINVHHHPAPYSDKEGKENE